MNIQPVGKNILLKKVQQEAGVNAAGLWVPDQTRHEDRHVVVAIGADVTIPITQGSIVYVTSIASLMTIQGHKFVHEDSVLGYEQ